MTTLRDALRAAMAQPGREFWSFSWPAVTMGGPLRWRFAPAPVTDGVGPLEHRWPSMATWQQHDAQWLDSAGSGADDWELSPWVELHTAVFTDAVVVPYATLQVLVDMACASQGSGSADDEEVALLRSAAVLLGVDPMNVTPPEFRCKYRGGHAYGPPSNLHSLTRKTIACVDCHVFDWAPEPAP